MIFLSAEQLVALHADLLERWGGEEGGGHRDALVRWLAGLLAGASSRKRGRRPAR